MKPVFNSIATMLVILAIGCSNGSSDDKLQYNVGDDVVLENGIGIETYDSGCKVPVCISQDVLEDFYWAVQDRNTNRIFQLHMDGSTVNIDCGTKARIESLYQDQGYKVYVLKGPQYGREFLVYYGLVSEGGD